ncbi:PQQ-dependent sugar dehydrogenase, partial [Flavitalea sp.]|nr:PQQ-dependent sugar dehydrogenase [Flavitalea sp.]
TIYASGLVPGNTYYCRVYSAGTGQMTSTGNFKILVTPSAMVKVTAGRMNEVFNQQILSQPSQLNDPWEVTYGPDNNLWITESKGYRVLKVNSASGAKDTVLDISQNSTFLELSERTFNCQFSNGAGAQGGCAGLALHPKFLDPIAPKNYVYLSYVYSQSTSTKFTNRLVRFSYNTSTNKLESPVSLCDTLPGSSDHNSQRMIIAPVGGIDYLFYASGDMGAGQFGNHMRPQNAQVYGSYEGKILRFNLEPDGDGGLSDWIPSTGSGDATNPYNATLGVQSAIWAMGIRNNQGFAYDPVLDKLYGSSHGPFSDDEINVIERGKNYGHPIVIGYAADGNANGTTAGASPGMTPANPSSCPDIISEVNNAIAIGPTYKDPLFSAYPNSTAFGSLKTLWDNTAGANAQWPSEGWSGLGLYTNTLIPGWSKSLVATSLKWGRLVRLRLNAAGTLTAPNNTAADTITYFGSINKYRDVAFSPDGKDIFVVMDKGTSNSGPAAANPIVPACAGCLQKYTFLGYADVAGKSSIPALIDVTSGAANSCNTGTTINIDNSNNNYWVPITGPDGNIMAEIYPNGKNLGTVTSSFYNNAGAVRVKSGASYADRNITITPQFQPSGTVKIRLYISKAEYDALDADPLSQVTTLADIKIHKNNDPCQNAISATSSIINPVYSEAHGTMGYMLQADIASFSSFYFAATSLTLPLNSITFKGNYKNEVSYLNWDAKNEVNTDHYDVERSTDHLIFETIGSVISKGNSSEKNKYNFIDPEASRLGVVKLYYRLKITDIDGSFAYSNIVAVDIPGSFITRISIFPNPADKQTTLQILSPNEQQIKWQLIDVAGRKIMSKEATLKKGENRIMIDLNNLRSGVYFLQVTGEFINAQEKIRKL